MATTAKYLTKTFSREYFSGCDVTLILGNQVIDEVTALELTVNERVEPVYGYMSYTFDHVAKGSRFVVGYFAINYVEPNYLLKAIGKPTQSVPIPVPPTMPKLFYGISEADFQEYKNRYTQAIWGDWAKVDPKDRPYFVEPEGGISIKIKFGKSGKKDRTVTGVRIFNPKLVVDGSGQPIMEQYNFLGQDYI